MKKSTETYTYNFLFIREGQIRTKQAAFKATSMFDAIKKLEEAYPYCDVLEAKKFRK